MNIQQTFQEDKEFLNVSMLFHRSIAAMKAFLTIPMQIRIMKTPCLKEKLFSPLCQKLPELALVHLRLAVRQAAVAQAAVAQATVAQAATQAREVPQMLLILIAKI